MLGSTEPHSPPHCSRLHRQTRPMNRACSWHFHADGWGSFLSVASLLLAFSVRLTLAWAPEPASCCRTGKDSRIFPKLMALQLSGSDLTELFGGWICPSSSKPVWKISKFWPLLKNDLATLQLMAHGAQWNVVRLLESIWPWSGLCNRQGHTKQYSKSLGEEWFGMDGSKERGAKGEIGRPPR